MECVWAVEASLGEGPLWDYRTGTLWFTDIKQGKLHNFNPATGDRRTVDVGGEPGWILPASDGGFVAGRNLSLFRFDGEKLGEEIARVDDPAHNRLNDATVDPQGRIWFGSMDNGCKLPTGSVHRYAAGTLTTVGGACAITNGPAVTGDGRWLYHVDTLAGIIWRFDIQGNPMLTDGEVFVRFDSEDRGPDGVIVDAEDHLWVAVWGGWCVQRYAPDGTLVQTVDLPVSQVTKVALGGPDLKTAYVTTARGGLSEANLADQPLAGGLFSFAVDVPGRPSARVVI